GRLFSAADDGSLAFLDQKTGARQGTLWLNNETWLMTTPEGLFDGSRSGRERVTYRVGGGLDVVSGDRLFKSCYQPNLLAALWKGDRPVPDFEFGKALPPLMRIISPK